MAAWVSATIVKAIAAIVPEMAAGFIVGGAAGCAPHALMVSVSMSTRLRIEQRFT
jgi:hypothetical protein